MTRIGLIQATLTVLVALIVTPTVTRAQNIEPTHRALDRWQPGLDIDAVGSVDTAKLPPPSAYDIWFAAGYAGNLLLIADRNADITGALVGPRLFSHLGGSVTLLPWLQVGADLPLVLYQDRGDPVSPAYGAVGPLSAGGLGDLRLTTKGALFSAQQTWVDLAFLLAIGLPTHAPTTAYLGDDSVTFSGTVAASRTLLGFDLNANLGYHWRPSVVFLASELGPEFRLGVGARYDLESLTAIPLAAEATWTLAARGDAPFSQINETPSELLFGATYRQWSPIVVSAAAGFGLVAGIGTPDVRFLVTVRWVGRPADEDGDRVVDAVDKCPGETEDMDGFEDEDGCPDPDNDGDGILDVVDECPDEPENENDVEDGDGCPDTGVSIESGRLSLGEKVHFEVNKSILKAKSRLLLNEVADVLQANPQINEVRIEGHTDSAGNDDANQRLSQARAEAVRTYLISRGVAAERLTAQGHGESQPLASNETERGRAQNRRVEFFIVSTAGDMDHSSATSNETGNIEPGDNEIGDPGE